MKPVDQRDPSVRIDEEQKWKQTAVFRSPIRLSRDGGGLYRISLRRKTDIFVITDISIFVQIE
jgi:hypothetical protein